MQLEPWNDYDEDPKESKILNMKQVSNNENEIGECTALTAPS